LSFTTILVADEAVKRGPEGTGALVRTITLNRPERRNALSPEMQAELIVAMEQAAVDRCRVLVLTGAGEAFCSGLDLGVLRTMTDASEMDHRAHAANVARMFRTLYELPMPTIAAVRGPAIAGGTGLATICDFTLATATAKFGFTEARIGFVPALVSAFAVLQIGDKRTRDLLLTARIFDAAEAQRLGLVNEVVAPEELDGRVRALAEMLVANSPESHAATKRLLVAQNQAWLDAAIAASLEENAAARTTHDFKEGVAAFLEKRKPNWAE
jgi:methylglutaconyl-CoA hydratase